ncbi:MAG: cyclic pyranopterin monophosphate synthase MoaC [Actinobacteria bacterium]|nr:MAG: cyclic pyranopterin monophosphate synthase MoaC [Actinomycetota bacterium]
MPRSATSCTSHGRSRTSGACSRNGSETRSTTACSRTTSSASTRTAGAGASCGRVATCSIGARVATTRVPDPARRPDRPVEERRPRLPGVRVLPGRPPRDARPREHARAARPVAAGHSRVRRVSGRDPARGTHGQRPLPAGRLDSRRPAHRGQLPALRRRLQAVRRAARERDLRRAEPHREGGAAGQRARRGADPVGERGSSRGAGAVGAVRQPVRPRGAGGRDRRGDHDEPRGAARAARGAAGARAHARRRRLAGDAARGSRPLVGEGGPVSDLSHVDETGRVRMVDVGGKDVSRRRAVAHASLRVAPATARRLRELPKGDALAAAQVAGIMAAKRTSELIPLCHPLPLTHVDVELSVAEASVEITASAETTAQTGVEMEALVAATVAALTVYDMAKAFDSEMELSEVRLVEKTKRDM